MLDVQNSENMLVNTNRNKRHKLENRGIKVYLHFHPDGINTDVMDNNVSSTLQHKNSPHQHVQHDPTPKTSATRKRRFCAIAMDNERLRNKNKNIKFLKQLTGLKETIFTVSKSSNRQGNAI